MSVVVLKDTTVELAAPGDCFLADIPHLILEIVQNNQIVDKVNLLSQESTRGIWSADEPLILPEVDADFRVNILMQVDENDRKLLSFIEANRLELLDTVQRQYEIPLICQENYPDLILRTRGFVIEDIQGYMAGSGQPIGDDRIQKIISEGDNAYEDFDNHGNLQSLDKAISNFESATEMIPKNDTRLYDTLTNLGISLLRRFKRLGKVVDMDGGIERLEMVAALTPDDDPDKPMYLTNLGNSLRTRFERLGNPADIDSAITTLQAAVDRTPAGHPHKPGYLNNLGISLQTRFERLGNLTNIDSSVAALQAAVDIIQDGHPKKPMYLTNLGNSLRMRFEQIGDLADVDNAITRNYAAVDLTPDDHPDKPGRLSNLGNSLQTRFGRLGNAADIDNAITALQAAVHLIPDGHPNIPMYLTNLGNALRFRFERLRKLADVDSAITRHQVAVDLTPDGHPDKPGRLSNLGNSLRVRFEELGTLADIDMAIDQDQAAVDLIPDGHPDKPGRLSNLGNSLRMRYEELRNTIDINNAITSHQKSINLTPDSHPSKSTLSYNLGIAFWARFRHLNSLQDSHIAIHHLSAAAQSTVGSPSWRFKAAQRWILIASAIKHQSLLQAYECAVILIPILAWLGLPMVDRHRHLVEMGGIVRDAAAAAISVGQYDKALEWLEQGRSVVWNQILQLRTPVDELRSVDPELADRLIQVSRLLDRGVDNHGGAGYREENWQQYRALTREWELTIERVRSLPKFKEFLRPLKVSRLMDAAQGGPVVVLNIAEERCDALALVAGLDEVVHVPLPNISEKKASELRDELKGFLYSNRIRTRGGRATERLADDEGAEDCGHILSELWNGVVRPVLNSLTLSPHPNVLPRIWWCATGPLAFLPIHAAGIYDTGAIDSQASEYVISSYTPTISALLGSPNHNAHSSFQLLSVIQPSAPGVSHIPNTKQELEHIRRCFGERGHIVLNGRDGTKTRVMKAMSESNWLHLACHGSQRRDEPTNSALILEDGHLTLKEIIKLDLPNAEFAYLSACQTTTGEETLSDEAVHIAGGMLLAGYRGVVATMWSIRDDLAPKVADEFYRRITSDRGRPDNRKAAEALHYSVEGLRKKGGVPFTSWVPFVHLGV